MKTLLLRCSEDDFSAVMAIPLTPELLKATQLRVNLAGTVLAADSSCYTLSFWDGGVVYEDYDEEALGLDDGQDFAIVDEPAATLLGAPVDTEVDIMHVHPDGDVHWTFTTKAWGVALETVSVKLLDTLKEAL